MSDIVQFLLDRIAEDEALARDSFYDGQHWYAEEESVLSYPGADDSDDVWQSDVKRDSYHVVNWQPRRVLAECAAKQAVIAKVAHWQHITVEDCWYSCGATFHMDIEDACCNDAIADECTCGLENRRLSILSPLANVYADHPDYDSSWSVDTERTLGEKP